MGRAWVKFQNSLRKASLRLKLRLRNIATKSMIITSNYNWPGQLIVQTKLESSHRSHQRRNRVTRRTGKTYLEQINPILKSWANLDLI